MTPKSIVLAAMSVAIASLSGAATAQQLTSRTYLVQLADEPLASYAGGAGNLQATRPIAGNRLQLNTAAANSYASYLNAKINSVIAQVPTAKIGYRYTITYNGFSANLTDAQVRLLEATPGVVRVSPKQYFRPSTNYSPTYLGLNAAGGAWSTLDAASRGIKGEDVIIADLDTGISPEHLAFADRVDAAGRPTFSPSGTLAYGPPPAKWKGICQTGTSFLASDCNNKLIGARWYYISDPGGVPADEVASPRGTADHGTHTGSTAAGNAGVIGNGATSVELGLPEPRPYQGVLSGMAPRARVAAYKVCWTLGCGNAEVLAAVEDAIRDGADIINFSISGSATDFNDPTLIAFLNAASAGIFVAASAGNSGPGASTLVNIAPWITTVAASNQPRRSVATLTLGNGVSAVGLARPQTTTLTAPLVLPSAVARAGQVPLTDCSDDSSWDESKVLGKVLVCDRVAGTADYFTSFIVRLAGGAGVVMVDTPTYNTPPPDSDAYVVYGLPDRYIALRLADRAALLAYAAQPNATVTMGASRYASPAGSPVAPVLAAFSSRGPNLGNLAIMKPDITAPGVAIVAAADYVPRTEEERAGIRDGTFRPSESLSRVLSGTSMSSPHIAGLAALVKQAHPSWSPAAIKSALMTSAGKVLLADGKPDPDRWGYGAGHVNPNAAIATDLVYDLSADDYKRFLCGIGGGAYFPTSSTCMALGAVPAWNLNLPSMTAKVVGKSHTFTRTLINMGSAVAQYVATASVPGFAVQVQPASLSLAPGQSQTFTVTATSTGATQPDWSFGSLVWSNGVKQVTSPISLQTVMYTVPATLQSKRQTGTLAYSAGIGFEGNLAVQAKGMTAPTSRQVMTVTHPDPNYRAFGCAPITVPAGTAALRLATFDKDVPAGNDVGLYLLPAGGNPFTDPPAYVSEAPGAQQSLTLSDPSPDGYVMCVTGAQVEVGGSLAVPVYQWNLGPNSPAVGSFKVIAPKTVKVNTKMSMALSWSVPPGIYVGFVDMVGTDEFGVRRVPEGPTVFTIDTVSAGTYAPGVSISGAQLAKTFAQLKATSVTPFARQTVSLEPALVKAKTSAAPRK